MKSRNTFRHILEAVAPANIEVLESTARAASSLASTYPHNETSFTSLESEALEQILRIVKDTADYDYARVLADTFPDDELVCDVACRLINAKPRGFCRHGKGG